MRANTELQILWSPGGNVLERHGCGVKKKASLRQRIVLYVSCNEIRNYDVMHVVNVSVCETSSRVSLETDVLIRFSLTTVGF